MPTPIEDLTAREQAEGAYHTLGPQKGQPIQPELVPPVIVAPVVDTPPAIIVPVAPPVTEKKTEAILKKARKDVNEEKDKAIKGE